MCSSTNKVDHTNYSIVTLFLLVLFHCHVSDTSFLKFRRRNQSRGTGRVILLRLPPIMIVLADDLQYIAGFKRDSSLCARYQLIFQRIIVELCSNEYLSVQKDSTISCICRIIQRDHFRLVAVSVILYEIGEMTSRVLDTAQKCYCDAKRETERKKNERKIKKRDDNNSLTVQKIGIVTW